MTDKINNSSTIGKIKDWQIYTVAMIPTVLIQLGYYMIDPTLKYFLPIFFVSLMPSTYIVYKLIYLRYEATGVVKQ